METDARTEGQPCHNCRLPMSRECVSVPAGGQVHNKHYCVGCGLLLGYVTRDEALAWYSDGHTAAAPGSKEEYFARLAGWPS